MRNLKAAKTPTSVQICNDYNFLCREVCGLLGLSSTRQK